jgi:hypothetical protein
VCRTVYRHDNHASKHTCIPVALGCWAVYYERFHGVSERRDGGQGANFNSCREEHGFGWNCPISQRSHLSEKLCGVYGLQK